MRSGYPEVKPNNRSKWFGHFRVASMTSQEIAKNFLEHFVEFFGEFLNHKAACTISLETTRNDSPRRGVLLVYISAYTYAHYWFKVLFTRYKNQAWEGIVHVSKISYVVANDVVANLLKY